MAFAKGKYAKAISDRSGMEFPYNEMIKEWNGSFVHIFFVKRIQDADATYTDATDVPYRFVPCMASGLSFYLAQKFAPQRVQELKLLYEDELSRALSEDGSSSSTYITPKTYYPNI